MSRRKPKPRVQVGRVGWGDGKSSSYKQLVRDSQTCSPFVTTGPGDVFIPKHTDHGESLRDHETFIMEVGWRAYITGDVVKGGWPDNMDRPIEEAQMQLIAS